MRKARINIRCYDNGGKTADRYTVVYLDHRDNRLGFYSSISMSENPTHPQGVGQHGSASLGSHLGKRIKFEELPEDCQKIVLRDLEIPDPIALNAGDIDQIKALCVKLCDSQSRRQTGDDDGASSLEDLIDEAYALLNGLVFRATFTEQPGKRAQDNAIIKRLVETDGHCADPEHDKESIDPGIWKIPVSMGAVNALREHYDLINPLVCERAQTLAIWRADQENEESRKWGKPGNREPGITRTDVECAIIDDLQNAVKAQAIRIRELITELGQTTGERDELRRSLKG